MNVHVLRIKQQRNMSMQVRGVIKITTKLARTEIPVLKYMLAKRSHEYLARQVHVRLWYVIWCSQI